MSFLTSIKQFILRLVKLTGTQTAILIMIVMENMLSKGSFLIVFYIIFYYDAAKTLWSNIPLMVLLGAMVGFWFAASEILRLQLEKTKKDVKGTTGWLLRGLYANRYIILFGLVYYYFTIRFSSGQVFLYAAIILACRFVAKYIQSWMLRLQDLDWSVIDGE